LDDQQRQQIVDPAKIAAGGVAAPLAALLTSRFGVAGTMIGLATSAVVATTVSDVLKAYLQRAPGTVKNIPGSARVRFSWKNVRWMVTAPFSWFLSLSPSRRRAMLISSIVAGVIAFLIATSAVTALEVGAGKNLSCWVWNECSTESSSGEEASSTSTLPSILGGGHEEVLSSDTLQEKQQPTAGSQSASSQPSDTARTAKTSGTLQSSKQTSASSQSSGQQTSSGAQQEEQQSSSPSRVVEEHQQSSSSDATGEQQSSSSSITEDQQQNPSSIPDAGGGITDGGGTSPQDRSF
jgi:hypothetical protein